MHTRTTAINRSTNQLLSRHTKDPLGAQAALTAVYTEVFSWHNVTACLVLKVSASPSMPSTLTRHVPGGRAQPTHFASATRARCGAAARVCHQQHRRHHV